MLRPSEKRELLKQLKPFLIGAEAKREYVYDDGLGHPTIGIGFNLDRKDAADVCKEYRVDYEKVIDDFNKNVKGKPKSERHPQYKISSDSIESIYEFTVDETISLVSQKIDNKDYIDCFENLPIAWQVALISHSFNGPSLIGSKIIRAVRTRDANKLAEELLADAEKAKPAVKKGIKKRYQKEANLIRNITDDDSLNEEDEIDNDINTLSPTELKNSIIEELKKTFGLNIEQITEIVESALNEHDMELEEIYKNVKGISGKVDQIINWQTAASDNQKRQKIIDTLNISFDFLQRLGAMVGSKELQQFAIVSKNAVVIATTLDGIISGTISGASIGLGIGAIAGAVLGLIGSFLSSGPNPTQIILEQLGKISKQIAELGSHIDEKLNAILEYQRKTFNVIIDGFNQLLKLIYDDNISLRIELRSTLQEIQSSLDFLARLQQENTRNQLVEPFERELGEIDVIFIKGVLKQEQFAKIVANLEAWIIKDLYNPSLTGENIFIAFKANTDDYVKKILDVIVTRDFDYNSMIGFFTNYAQARKANPLTSPRSEERAVSNSNLDVKLPNIRLWFTAIQYYYSLNEQFLEFDTDTYNLFLKSIIDKAQSVVELLQSWGNDTVLWKGLLSDYYTCLQSIQDNFTRYVMDYNQRRQDDCNKRYNGDVKDGYLKPQNPITDLNILSAPDQLINKFNNRSISRITGGIIPANDITGLADPSLKQLNVSSLFVPLQSSNLLPRTWLCAEYLQLVSFTSRQINPVISVDLSDYIKSYIPVIKIKPSEYQKTLQEYLERDDDGNFQKKIGKPDLSKDFGRSIKMGAEDVQVSSWQLPIELSFDYLRDQDRDNEGKVVELLISGNWQGMERCPIDMYNGLNNKLKITHEGEYDVYNYSYTTPDWANTFAKHLIAHVAKTFNKEGKFTWENSPSYADQYATGLRKTIHNWFFEHRKTIAFNLLPSGGKGDGNAQDYIDKFRNELRKLDSYVFLISSFAYLAGFDTNKSILDTLVNSNMIIEEISEKLCQESNVDAEIDPVTRIKMALIEEHKITLQQIGSSPKFKPLPEFHPQNLLLVARTKLMLLEQAKAFFKVAFPHLYQYVDQTQYLARQELYQNEFFENEIYTILQEIKAKGFEDAKFWSQRELEKFVDIKEEELRVYLKDIISWIEKYSKDKSAIAPPPPTPIGLTPIDYGESTNIQKIQLDLLIDEAMSTNKILPYIKYVLSPLHNSQLDNRKFTWPNGIRLLMTVAESQCNYKFDSSFTPFNFAMWADGSSTYRSVILNSDPQFSHLVLKITNRSEQKEELSLISEMGQSLRAIIYSLASAVPLFEYLFARYQDLLTELKERIKKWSDEKDNTILQEIKDKMAFDQFFKNPTGTEFALLDTMDTLGLLLIAYTEMALGYELVGDKSLLLLIRKFMFKDIFIDYLRDVGLSYKDYPLLQRFTDYYEDIKQLHTETVNKIILINKLINFANMMQDQISNNCVILKPTETGDKLIPEMIKLMGLFLHEYAYITKIVITDLEITNDALEQLIFLITTYPSIREIHLINLKLTLSHLKQLLPVLKSSINLVLLNLYNNKLGARNAEDNLTVSFDLAAILRALSNIKIINLAKNSLTENDMSAIIAALQINQFQYGQIPEKIDLSENLVTVDIAKNLVVDSGTIFADKLIFTAISPTDTTMDPSVKIGKICEYRAKDISLASLNIGVGVPELDAEISELARTKTLIVFDEKCAEKFSSVTPNRTDTNRFSTVPVAILLSNSPLIVTPGNTHTTLDDSVKETSIFSRN